MGYIEMAIDVEKDNENAVHFYKNSALPKFCLTVRMNTENI